MAPVRIVGELLIAEIRNKFFVSQEIPIFVQSERISLRGYDEITAVMYTFVAMPRGL